MDLFVKQVPTFTRRRRAWQCLRKCKSNALMYNNVIVMNLGSDLILCCGQTGQNRRGKKAGNPHWKGRISKIDLVGTQGILTERDVSVKLALTLYALVQISYFKTELFPFLQKAILTRRSTVLRLPLQLRVPCLRFNLQLFQKYYWRTWFSWRNWIWKRHLFPIV